MLQSTVGPASIWADIANEAKQERTEQNQSASALSVAPVPRSVFADVTKEVADEAKEAHSEVLQHSSATTPPTTTFPTTFRVVNQFGDIQAEAKAEMHSRLHAKLQSSDMRRNATSLQRQNATDASLDAAAMHEVQSEQAATKFPAMDEFADIEAEAEDQLKHQLKHLQHLDINSDA